MLVYYILLSTSLLCGVLKLLRMVDKHFFQPLLPGFHSHLTIPVAFFSKYIEGRNDQKTAKLRSDASKITWEVRIEDGQKLTGGWKEFALAHDLRIGDILIFRQEKDMAFHVTLLGPSCCEIQYESCLDDDHNLGKVPQKKKVKKNPRKETDSSSLDPSCFVSTVAPSTLRYDSLYFPISFTRANGLGTSCGKIVLMNEKGTSWTLPLIKKQCGNSYIRPGWRSFCMANGLKAGDLFTFKVIQRGRTPVLRLSSTESESEEESSEGDEVESLSTEPECDEETNENIQRKKNRKREAESYSLDPSCYVANVTPSSLRDDMLCLPRSFVRANDLEERRGEIVLMNEKGSSWTLNLKRKNSCGTMYITRGWRSFCIANGLTAGSFFTSKLINRGGTLALRLSSQPQNQFVTILTPKPFNLKNHTVFLPFRFTRRHGINADTKMTMLDNNGVKWATDLRSEKRGGRIRLVGGWKEFFEANCVKTSESIIVKLIWEGDKSCVLKFCSKVTHDTK